MSRCAVCQNIDNVVINLIMANPNSDQPPLDCFLVELLDGMMCDFGWIYDPLTNTFTDPNPPPPEIP